VPVRWSCPPAQQYHRLPYVVIAGRADRSRYQRQITVRPGDSITLNLTIAPATGSA
jgi:hypothetical protein